MLAKRPTYPVPLARLTFDPQTGCYGFDFRFEGRRVHESMSSFPSLEWEKRWADPWNELRLGRGLRTHTVSSVLASNA